MEKYSSAGIASHNLISTLDREIDESHVQTTSESKSQKKNISSIENKNNEYIYEDFSSERGGKKKDVLRPAIAQQKCASFYDTMSSYVSVISSSLSEEAHGSIVRERKEPLLKSNIKRRLTLTKDTKDEIEPTEETIPNINMKPKSTRDSLISIRYYIQGYLRNNVHEDNYEKFSLSQKARVISRDVYQFRELKKRIQRQGIITNLAVKETLPNMVENFYSTDVDNSLKKEKKFQFMKRARSFRLTKESLDDHGMNWNLSTAVNESKLYKVTPLHNLAWREE